jgi:hypothetical protein
VPVDLGDEAVAEAGSSALLRDGQSIVIGQAADSRIPFLVAVLYRSAHNHRHGSQDISRSRLTTAW